MKILLKGCDEKGRPLNEASLPGCIPVIYRGKIYFTGNRYHNEVELYRNGEFIMTAPMARITVIYEG